MPTRAIVLIWSHHFEMGSFMLNGLPNFNRANSLAQMLFFSYVLIRNLSALTSKSLKSFRHSASKILLRAEVEGIMESVRLDRR